MQISATGSIDVMREQLDEALRGWKADQVEIHKLRAQIAWLKRQLMGRKSERRPDLITGKLFEDSLAEDPPVEAPADPETKSSRPKRAPRKVGGRRKLPDDLPRQVTEIYPPAGECHCSICDIAKIEIGREVSEQLEYQPGSLLVLRVERVKLACPGCHEGVSCAALPPRPIDRGLPGPGLLAFVLTSKYSEHSTLYRLEDILKRHGLSVARSTMCGWVGAAAMLLDPIVQEMRRELLAGKYAQSDDTGVRLLGGQKEGGSKRSHLWVYRWGKGLVIYDFTKSRSRDGPLAFLGDFEGYLQADAYSGYDVIFKSGRVKEVGCWAHTRRYFIKAEDSDPELATEMVGMIRALYRIETLAKDDGLTPDARLALRQERSIPILDAIWKWLDDQSQTVLPKSALGQAITYTKNQWEALKIYTSDGQLEIDNNPSERAMRPVAVGRKNWLFFAGEAGGKRAATIFSLVTSCKDLGLDPFAYFKDVLDRVSDTPQSRVRQLTPRGWKAARDQMAALEPALPTTATASQA